MDKTGRSLWQLLLLIQDANKPVQLTCGECFVLLDYDAGLLADGVALKEVRPAINRHLSLCSTYRVQLDEWLKELDGTRHKQIHLDPK
jgi:hypothetical protein